MSPQGIFLYEIDKSFGPSVIAEFYLSKEKISKEILKKFEEKHIRKEFVDATAKKGGIRYYSSVIKSESIKERLFLGFILKEEEELISLKSSFEKSEEIIVKNYDKKDKAKMQKLLKEILESILSLMEKLQEPRLIIETINEKTKQMLDNGNLQEARELIDLGEKVPQKLAEEIKIAEQFLGDGFYKKARKSYLNAAKLANQIQEHEIFSFLESKAEQVGKLPDLIKERENIHKDIKKIVSDLEENKLYLYKDLINPLNKLISIAQEFNEDELLDILTEVISKIQRANSLAKEIYKLDDIIKEAFKKFLE